MSTLHCERNFDSSQLCNTFHFALRSSFQCTIVLGLQHLDMFHSAIGLRVTTVYANKKHFVPRCTVDSRALWQCCELVRRLSAEAKNPEECEWGAGEMQGIVQTYCIHSFPLFAFFETAGLGPFSIF